MKCKICHEKARPLLDKQFNHTYYYCEACHFIFIKPDHHVSLEEEKEVYELHENSLDDEGYVTYLEGFIDEAVVPFINTGKGLDFGSGPEPVLAALLRKRGYDIDIFDKHYAQNSEIWSKEYDFITSTEVVEHFHDPLETLEDMVSLLKPGGFLAIMTLFLQEDLTLFQDWWYRRDPTHIAFYSPKTFQEIARKLGLEVVYENGKRICVLKKIA